jgi:AcrR family transcriptional regulator
MPKLKPEEVERRKREILEAARRCFMRNGFHQTTTDEICQEASITPGGLYHYFGSKEEIISAVIEETARVAVTRWSSVTDGAGDARSALREIGAFFSRAMRDPNRDNATRFDIETWAETLRNEDLAQITRRSWLLRRQWVRDLIARGGEEGVYQPGVNPQGVADLMLAAQLGLRVSKLLRGEEFDLEAAVASLFLMYAGRLTEEQGSEAIEAQRSYLEKTG